MLILTTGYETVVRSKLGAKESEVPDTDINQPLFVDLAEAIVIKRVPEYSSITDAVDLLLIQNAVVSYICYLIAPSMGRRVNQEVSTIDVKWKKERVDWDERAQQFLADYETSLSQISTVVVDGDGVDAPLISKITSNRNWDTGA
ncbi:MULTISPECIES: hypothetical protein [unclassified Paenibacillus]|uniref:hypothetical protein n=1 Tax=unclassified Paenibacillus TaxID=185978 RepID=UPI00089D5BF8|nr:MULTISPECIES: hypothetical protein [unclassified Paenibacillus]OMC68656.1 hypothetical protein BK126_12575 [Paenibacillus sp. FSL H7-0326]SDW56012.1 hypothetical protein SAMN05518848_102178 [Paenibacillus sp. PDC88]